MNKKVSRMDDNKKGIQAVLVWNNERISPIFTIFNEDLIYFAQVFETAISKSIKEHNSKLFEIDITINQLTNAKKDDLLASSTAFISFFYNQRAKMSHKQLIDESRRIFSQLNMKSKGIWFILARNLGNKRMTSVLAKFYAEYMAGKSPAEIAKILGYDQIKESEKLTRAQEDELKLLMTK